MLDHVKVCGQEDSPKKETSSEAEAEAEGSATSDMVSNFRIHSCNMRTISKRWHREHNPDETGFCTSAAAAHLSSGRFAYFRRGL